MATRFLPSCAFFLVVATVMIPALGQAQQQREPLRDGDVIRGELRLVEARHPNGTRIEAFQVVSATGYVLPGDDLCEAGVPLRKFHVVAKDGDTRKQFQRSLGKVLSVKGRQFYCAHTAWHIGDAVALEAEIVGER